jgi:hypothetical protein
MAKIFREAEIQPSNPTGQDAAPAGKTVPFGASPVEPYRALEERMGKVEKTCEGISKSVSKMEKRLRDKFGDEEEDEDEEEDMEEGAGETRDPTVAGPEAPRALQAKEKLSKRKSIVGGTAQKESFDPRNAVKAFLKTTGGAM